MVVITLKCSSGAYYKKYLIQYDILSIENIKLSMHLQDKMSIKKSVLQFRVKHE